MQTDTIPNILYFCFGFKPQTEDFLFGYHVAIWSAYTINRPDVIRFVYHHEPRGEWWEKTKEIPCLELVKIDIPETLGRHKIHHVAHKADVARMNFLYDTGGVYMDIDTISVRSYRHLLDNDVVLGRELPNGICNAIMFTKPRSDFFNIWLKNYESVFRPDGWREASILLPEAIHNKHPDLATVLPPEAFFLPHCHETHKIFVDDNDVPGDLITLHLWEKFSLKYLNKITDWQWAQNNINTLYGKLLNRVLPT